MQLLKDLWSARELLRNLVLREVRGQYKRTLLGRLWSLMNPLALMCIYTFIFSMVFRAQPEIGDPSGIDLFPLWLLCGLLPWIFFSLSVNTAANSLVANAALISKVYFPRAVLPIAAVGTVATNWLVEMLVLGVALIVVGAKLLPWIPLLILFMCLLAAFASGLGAMLAILNLYFRDVQYLLSIILQFWMYLTPIIYPASMVRAISDDIGGLMDTPVTLFDFYTMNPLYHFVTAFRQLLYDNRWPDAEHFISCAIWAVFSMLIAGYIFTKNDKRIAEMV